MKGGREQGEQGGWLDRTGGWGGKGGVGGGGRVEAEEGDGMVSWGKG